MIGDICATKKELMVVQQIEYGRSVIMWGIWTWFCPTVAWTDKALYKVKIFNQK